MAQKKKLLYKYKSVTGETWKVREYWDEETRYIAVGCDELNDLIEVAIPEEDPTFCVEHRALSWETYLLGKESFTITDAPAILARQLPLFLSGKQAASRVYLEMEDATSRKVMESSLEDGFLSEKQDWIVDLDEKAATSRGIIESRVADVSDELTCIPGRNCFQVCLASKRPLSEFFTLEELQFMFEFVHEVVDEERTKPLQLSESEWRSLMNQSVADFMTELNRQPSELNRDKSDWRNHYHRNFMTSLLCGAPLLVAIGENYLPYAHQ